jgi:hypothetical protein
MKVIKKLNPEKAGTKKYLEQYGNKLLCVRYRYDETNQEQLTTIEYIINRKRYLKLTQETQRKLFPHPNRHVLLKIEFHEEALRNQVKQHGGTWLKDERMWKLPCHKALDLGLQQRMKEIK